VPILGSTSLFVTTKNLYEREKMFEGFKHLQIQTSDTEVKINLRYGGDGPPVLLIHGNPLTHVHWHLVAPRLMKDFTVVATDLRGYGDSSKPRGKEDHSNYSFRRMAQDQIDDTEAIRWMGILHAK
jgi:haloacetate dehalogenase